MAHLAVDSPKLPRLDHKVAAPVRQQPSGVPEPTQSRAEAAYNHNGPGEAASRKQRAVEAGSRRAVLWRGSVSQQLPSRPERNKYAWQVPPSHRQFI